MKYIIGKYYSQYLKFKTRKNFFYKINMIFSFFILYDIKRNRKIVKERNIC